MSHLDDADFRSVCKRLDAKRNMFTGSADWLFNISPFMEVLTTGKVWSTFDGRPEGPIVKSKTRPQQPEPKAMFLKGRSLNGHVMPVLIHKLMPGVTDEQLPWWMKPTERG
jgi:hypothetical protein